MSNSEIFFWGVAGSLMSFAAIYALPALRKLLELEEIKLPKGRVIVYLLIMVIVAVLGGLFAIVMGDAMEPKHAVFYGAGWEAGIKGLDNAIRKN